MNAIDLLKQQHEEVMSLFEEFEKAEDSDEKLALVQELAANLGAHATIEEKIFYPAAFANSTEDLLKEAVEEHLSVKRILADLIAMGPDEENFDAKVKVLQEQIEHHVGEEEGELFKKVAQQINPEMLETLGEQMEEMFERELDEDPTEKIAEETLEAAPLPKKPKRQRPQA